MKNFGLLAVCLFLVGCGSPQGHQGQDVRMASFIANNCAMQLEQLDRLIPASTSTQNLTWKIIRNPENKEEVIALQSEESQFGINPKRVYTLSNAVTLEVQGETSFQVLASDHDLNLAPFPSPEKFQVLYVKQTPNWIQSDLHVITKADMDKIKMAHQEGSTLSEPLSTQVEGCYAHSYKTVPYISLEGRNIEGLQEAQKQFADKVAYVTTSFRVIEMADSENPSEGPQLQGDTFVTIDISSQDVEDNTDPMQISFTQSTEDFLLPISFDNVTDMKNTLDSVESLELQSKDFNPLEFVFDLVYDTSNLGEKLLSLFGHDKDSVQLTLIISETEIPGAVETEHAEIISPNSASGL